LTISAHIASSSPPDPAPKRPLSAPAREKHVLVRTKGDLGQLSHRALNSMRDGVREATA
jgi:hypothetical protein